MFGGPEHQAQKGGMGGGASIKEQRHRQGVGGKRAGEERYVGAYKIGKKRRKRKKEET